MPLNKGAKPGSKGFGENIATERRAGKPAKQAEAIAYSEAKDVVRVRRDAKGQMHVFLPGNQAGYREGIMRTLLRGNFGDRKRTKKDMDPGKFKRLEALLVEFLNEESEEPEHQQDCTCGGH